MPGNEPSDHELDRLLSAARWSELREGQISRLNGHWRRLQSARRQRRRIGWGALAAAASVLLVAGVVSWLGRESAPQMKNPGGGLVLKKLPPDEPRAIEHEPAPSAPAASPSATPPATDKRWAVVPRDPNVYERVILAGAMGKRKPTSHAMDERLVEDTMAALAIDADADVDDRLTDSPKLLVKYEQLLAAALRQGNAERRLGAARLLARIGTRRSMPVLADLVADPATHEPAVLGLGRLVDERNLAQLASQERDATLRDQLLAMLLARRTLQAVALYLEFVSSPALRSEALRVVAEMDNPPADVLLAYLESPQNSQRLAAGLALSRVLDPAVVERLCNAVSGIGRQEALIALLLNESEKASGCLKHARSNVYLIASLHAAEQRLDTLQIRWRGKLP